MTRRNLTQFAALGAVARSMKAADAPFTLPPLPYGYDALEPYIDVKTMEIHHDKHHQAYVDNRNKAVASNASLAGKSLDDLVSNLDTLPGGGEDADSKSGRWTL